MPAQACWQKLILTFNEELLREDYLTAKVFKIPALVVAEIPVSAVLFVGFRIKSLIVD